MTTNNFLTNRMKLVNFTIGLFLSLNCFGQVPTFVPTNRLVGWWPFDGNANDKSGNGFNGTVLNAISTTDRFGDINKAYSFNNATGGIVINNILAIDSIYSISCWVNSNVPIGSQARFISNDWSNCGEFVVYQNNPGTFGFGTNQTCSSNVEVNNDTIHLNSWYHVTAIRNLDSIKLYINGVLASSDFNNSQNSNIANKLFIGGDPFQPLGFFNGKIDDLGIWSRALTSQEVSNLYTGNICFQSVTVTDTLIINTNITSFNPVKYLNSIKIWPNPTNDHITIDNGNISNLAGYQIKITSSLGQQIFLSSINQQQFYIDLTTWSGLGIYFVQVLNSEGNLVDVRKILLQ